MENLSHLAAEGPWVSSMSAGNRTSDSTLAFTAPGSSPVDPEVADVHQSDPHVDIGAPRQRTVLHPSGAPRIGNPWSKADGTAWEEADPDISGGRAPAGPWRQT